MAKNRLAAYLEVENTYLSTVKVLGGLGLVLGTLGLAAVLLRNTWERRKELGLLQALGYRRYAIGLIIISETAVIRLLGMAIGTVSAGMAVFGHIMSRTSTVSWFSIMLMLAGVLTFGLLAGIAALVTVFRFSALSTLRSD